MRVRLKTGPAALFGAIFVVALVLLLPMRVALGWFGAGAQGLTAREVRGSIWGGTLREAAFGDIALGDLKAGVSPLALLVGRARIAVDSLDGTSLHGALIVSRHSAGIADTTASIATGRVFDPLPVASIDLAGVQAVFEDDRCARAEGNVRVLLNGGIAGIDVSELRGDARCDAGALLLPLTGAGGTASAMVRIEGDGRFHADLSVQPLDADAGQKLVLSGLQPGPRGYTLSTEGHF
ncbi:MAG: type II secretion system protein N [Pseudomonadota bacterium]|nr:type II secretion system protein N [Pseudomonadota bacterium]